MRYADVILMLSEVNNDLGDDAKALQYLDMVRGRAGLPTYAVSITNGPLRPNYSKVKLAIPH